MIVAWTGHRPDLFLDPAAAQAAVNAVARELAQRSAASGGAARPTAAASHAASATVVSSDADSPTSSGSAAASPRTTFLVGGQRGVDTWAAEAAFAHGLPFTLVLPFEPATFTQDWEPADRTRLEHALARAHAVHIAGGYTPRNQLLTETADLLVAVWTRTAGGGTAETIAFARAAGIPIREIVLPPSPRARAATGRGI